MESNRSNSIRVASDLVKVGASSNIKDVRLMETIYYNN